MKDDVRIIHIAQSITGGIASYFEEIQQHQAISYGQSNVFFMIPSGSQNHIASISPDQIVTFPTRGGRTPYELLSFGVATSEAIKRIKPTIVHLHSTFAGAIIRLLLAFRLDRPRIIYCPHGWAFGMEVSAAHKRFYALCEVLFASITDVIIVNSEAEQALGLQYHIPATKMTTIRNGVSAAPGRTDENDPDILHLGFIGRCDRQKGLDILLAEMEAAACERIHLHVVGNAVVDNHSAIRHIPRRVTFHGWRSHAEVLALLPKMDAVVMPSRWEAFGLTAVEAMRCGVPVIASNRGALPEIVRHGLDGLIVDISKTGELGRVLSGLDREQLQRMGRTAQGRFRTEFTSDRMNALLDNVYRRLTSDLAQAATGAEANAVSCAMRVAGGGMPQNQTQLGLVED